MAVSELAMNALSGALQLEQDGHAFYVKAAARVQDETVKQTMLSLAEDEKIHEAMIARQMQALREEAGFLSLFMIWLILREKPGASAELVNEGRRKRESRC